MSYATWLLFTSKLTTQRVARPSLGGIAVSGRVSSGAPAHQLCAPVGVPALRLSHLQLVASNAINLDTQTK